MERLNFALSLATAALLVLCFPNHNLTWLAPLALVPLLIGLAREPRGSRRFCLGWAAGIVYWFAACNWIQFTLQTHGNMSAALAWALFLLFCLTKGLHLAAFGWLAGFTVRSKWLAVPATAGLWVLIERLHAPLGFAWLMLGNAAIDWRPLLRMAPFAGVWGVSFLLALCGSALAVALVRKSLQPLVWLALVAAVWLLPPISESTGTEKAILVQPNLPETSIWTEDMLARTEQRMKELSLAPIMGSDRKPRLLVWPEAPAPFYDSDHSFRDYTAGIARAGNAYFSFGLVGHGGVGAIYNSALAIGPNGQPLARYDKVHLVPFGEFVPWPFNLFVTKISTETGDFTGGRDVVVTQVGDHRLSTFICYESVFPGFIRKSVRDGAELLLNPSNDGWFGKTAAREQHLEIVRMRAAENERWILRATNDGITASIDPAGRVIKRLEPFEELTALMPFAWERPKTFYTRWGDWFVWPSALLAGAGIFESLRGKAGVRA